MKRRISQDLTVTDLFCGAGGSSIGAEKAGATLRMAANHWSLAIETHSSTFPHADHDCANISQTAPRRYPTTEILIASPECTNHSSAKTNKHRPDLFNAEGDPSEERSRATMWDVPRFAEFHKYELVVVENVVEARRWAPFDSWLGAMHSLGYEHRALYMNSFIAHPTPQSRDRMYVVFWKKGNRAPDLEFHPVCWCGKCEADVRGIQSWKNPTRPYGKYRSQYVYRCPKCAEVVLPYVWPAAAAIDWSLPMPRIGDRVRPLAEATMRRIRVGLERYGPAAIVQAAGHTYERPGYYRTWPTWIPLGTQTTTIQHALVLETAFSGSGDSNKGRSAMEPFRTQTGQQSQALVVTMRGTDGRVLGKTARPAMEPVGPLTAGGIHEALVVPMRSTVKPHRADSEPLSTLVASASEHALLVPLRKHGKAMRTKDAPVPTVAAAGLHHGVVVPFLTDHNGNSTQKPVTEPFGTIPTRDRWELVEPRINIEDCGFRMLEPIEIGRAMAFEDNYIVKGNKRERVRQYGNAVTPPVMSIIMERGIASLRGR